MALSSLVMCGRPLLTCRVHIPGCGEVCEVAVENVEVADIVF